MRFYRIVLNFFSSLSRNIVGLGLGLIATPLILKFLGEEKFGAFRVLMDWMSHLGILEFGLFSALLPIFAQSLSKDADYNPKTVTRQAFKKYLMVMTYQLFGLFFVFFFLDYLVPVSISLKRDLRFAAAIFGVSQLFVFSQIFKAYLDASQRGYLLSATMAMQNIIYIALALFFAYQGMGIAGQAAAFGISLGVSFFTLGFLSLREIQKYDVQQGAHRYFQRSLKTQRIPNFLAHLCGRTSFLMDNIIISALLGAKVVTAFYLTQRLLQIAMQQLQQLGNATWPAMSELFFQGEMEKYRQRVLDVTEFIAFAAGALLSVLTFINPAFIKLWTGPETFSGITLSNIVVVNTGLIAINSFWLWCFAGAGFISKTLPMLGVQAVVNLSLSFVATSLWGVTGPALGTLISFLFITQPWTTYLLHKEFGVPIGRLTRVWLMPFFLPVGISIGLSIFMGAPKIESWWLLILASMIYSAIAIGLFPLVFIQARSRKKVYKRLRDLVASKLKKSTMP